MLKFMVVPDRNVWGALDAQGPHAGLVGKHFAIAIHAHAAARTIAQIFRTAHRAGHSGRMQNALSAHAAIEYHFLGNFFHRQKNFL